MINIMNNKMLKSHTGWFVVMIAVGASSLVQASPEVGFVSYNAGNSGTEITMFQFLALADISGSQKIQFSDSRIEPNGFFAFGEGELEWAAPAGGIEAFTVVEISVVSGIVSSTVGSITPDTGFDSPSFSLDGDSIAAFVVSPQFEFIAVMNNNGNGVFQSNPTGETDCSLPPGAVIGFDAIALQETNNAKYIGPTEVATVEELRAAIFDNINFQRDDVNVQRFTGTFSFPQPTSDPTASPTNAPTSSPSPSPTNAPTPLPTVSPSTQPSVTPSLGPVILPSITPTASPSERSTSPTIMPSGTVSTGVPSSVLLYSTVGGVGGISALALVIIGGRYFYKKTMKKQVLTI